MRVTGSARCAAALSAASFIIACSVVKRSGLTKRSTPALEAASEAAVATAVTHHRRWTKASGCGADGCSAFGTWLQIDGFRSDFDPTSPLWMQRLRTDRRRWRSAAVRSQLSQSHACIRVQAGISADCRVLERTSFRSDQCDRMRLAVRSVTV
jgi:hypothetical protein